MSTETPQAGQANTTPAQGNPQTPAVDASAAVSTPAAQVPAAEVAKPIESQTVVPGVVPEKYDLKMPEGSPLKPEYLEKISSYAKEKKLSNDQAQELLQQQHSVVDEFLKQQVTEFEQTASAWKEQAMKDPEIGGEAFTKNVELAHRALEQFGTPQFRAELSATGYGNHPELVRIFARIGKKMADDKMVVPGAQTGGNRSYEDVFYGDKNK